MNGEWPEADLDPVRRLRVMAAVTPSMTVAELVVDAPLDRVWATVADLEREMPRLIRDFRSVRVVPGAGDRLEMFARGRFGQRARFDMVMWPGWCWMQSRFLVGGLAAAETGTPGRTRIAFGGGVRLRGAGVVGRVAQRPARGLALGALRRLEADILRD